MEQQSNFRLECPNGFIKWVVMTQREDFESDPFIDAQKQYNFTVDNEQKKAYPDLLFENKDDCIMFILKYG